MKSTVKREFDYGNGVKLQVVMGTDEMIKANMVPGRLIDGEWHIRAKGHPLVDAMIIERKDASHFEATLFRGDCTILANCTVYCSNLIDFAEAMIPAANRAAY